jgi:hypothetical protein
MMKIYGELSDVQKHAGFTELSRITIALTPEAMERFARFVTHAAAEMKRIGQAYDHIHLMDVDGEWDAAWPDVVLARLDEDRA